MAYDEITTLLDGWPGFDIQTVTRQPGGTHSGASQIMIELIAQPTEPTDPRYCSRCGYTKQDVHDVTLRHAAPRCATCASC